MIGPRCFKFPTQALQSFMEGYPPKMEVIFLVVMKIYEFVYLVNLDCFDEFYEMFLMNFWPFFDDLILRFFDDVLGNFF